MTPNDNPYRAPGGEGAGDASRAPFRFALAVFSAWVVGASLVGGAALAWSTAHALAHFDAQARTAALVALASLRVCAAQVSSTAAGIALVAGTHHRSAAGVELRPSWPPWRIYALVLLAWPLSAGLMIGAGILVPTAYDVEAATSWRNVLMLVTPEDPFFGAACAALDALVLGAIASAALPRLAGAKAGVAAKVVTVLVVTAVVGGAVQGMLGACLPEGW